MANYWLTFRIHDDATYEKRRDQVYAAIEAIASPWWGRTNILHRLCIGVVCRQHYCEGEAAFNRRQT